MSLSQLVTGASDAKALDDIKSYVGIPLLLHF